MLKLSILSFPPLTLSSPCRTMTLYFKEETEDVNGLPGYRYWGTNQTLPGDGCYCVEGVCAPSGEALAGRVCWVAGR